MAKITKKQEDALWQIESHLSRAFAFIMEKDTVVAKSNKLATTVLHYTRKHDDSVIYSISKEYGSNLTGLEMGLGRLRRFLNDNCY